MIQIIEFFDPYERVTVYVYVYTTVGTMLCIASFSVDRGLFPVQ